MKVIVPSLGRAGTSTSMGWLSTTSREVVLAVHGDEVAAYKKAYPRAGIMKLPDSCRKHAGLVRKEILRREKKPFFFVDDDISVRLVTAKSHDEMLNTLERHVATVPMTGIGKQIFSQGIIKTVQTINGDKMAVRNKFVSTVYAIDPREFTKCPLEQLQVYEDCALILHAIRAGGTIVTFSATHTNKTPPVGGCNSWRTERVVRQSMDALVRLYPDLVRKVETKHTAHGHDLGIGVRVAWSRAGRS